MPTDSHLAELAALSAELGRDPAQVQAGGGNASIKHDGVLWVKASGFWLADAEKEQIFVPVRQGPVLAAIQAEAADPVSPAVDAARNPRGLRPSIETTMHALLPHDVVVHTHSVRTLAFAACEDAQDRLAQRLDGLRWAFAPYAHPGLPLTRAIAAALESAPADVLVLGNHGLVVGAASVAAARTLLAEVERRLDAPARPLAAGRDLDATAQALGLRPARHGQAHGLARDQALRAQATAGSYYPDHVIFLGPAAATVATPGEVEEAVACGHKLLLVAGKGAFLPQDAIAAADELALCLALVLARVPQAAALRPIGPDKEALLLDWDAEKYRQDLAKARQ